MSSRPNEQDHNFEDCALMYGSDHQYNWRDVFCTEGHIENHPVSFICQKYDTDVETTTGTSATTTTELSTTLPTESTTPVFPGK